MTADTASGIDYRAIKEKQRAAWQTGDFARVGTTMQSMAERLVEAAAVHADERVLDVGCGQGNAALAAARRFADATGIDYVPDLLAQGRARAAADGLPVEFTEADAEQLPFAPAAFDVVLSTVGVMFAPDQERAASELLRVTRPGGRIALASWTPEGMVGALFTVIASYGPPPAGLRSPMAWGSPVRLAELFGDAVHWTAQNRRIFEFVYRSPEHFADWFGTYYGPLTRLRGSLDDAARDRLRADLADVAHRFNTATDGTTVAEAEYLEVVGVRR
jgi:ubiquinone/menaquinone biosynthesis C-methylase UbiE